MMKKFLEKLPTEGLLIIVVVLISLIVVIYMTKIDSVVESHNKIIVTNISENKDNNAIFISNKDDIDENITLDKPIEEIVEEKIPIKTTVRLFFIKVTDDGEITLKSVLKSMYTGTTPLGKSLEQLLIGPDTEEINRGLLTLIPEGAKILSISIKDGIAYLNFNELFRFNPLGVEGYLAQIKQIVYTATEFDSVKSVQFTIDGAKQEYLGPEGVYIGRPISRDDFEL